MGMRIQVIENYDEGYKITKGIKKFMKLRRRNGKKNAKKILKDLKILDTLGFKFG